MRRMHEGEDARDEQYRSCQRMAEQRRHADMIWRANPSQWECKAEQQEEHRHQQRRNDAAAAEHQPEKRFRVALDHGRYQVRSHAITAQAMINAA